MDKMTRDRLVEFRQKGNITVGDLEVAGTIVPIHGFDVGPTVLQGNDVVIEMGWIDSEIGRFLKQVESLREEATDLRGYVEKIKYLHGSLLDSPTRNEETEAELDRLMATVKSDSRNLMNKLKEMEKANMATLQTMDASQVTVARIKKLHHSALLTSFVELLDYYQGVQRDYQEKCKSRVKTMLIIRNGSAENIEEMELDDIIEGNGHFGNLSVFTDGFQEKTEEAKRDLAFADARFNDLRKIEAVLRELNELFIEMSQLVMLQGERIDNIEKNVMEAKEFVEDADAQLVNAQKLQKSARKKLIIIIIVVIILLLVLALIIAGSVGAFTP